MKQWAFLYHQKTKGSISTWHSIEKYLKKRDIDYWGIVCPSQDDLKNAAYRLAKEGVENIIVVGGDTSLNDVVNGVMKCDAAHPTIGVIPNGKVNDFARFWGWTKGSYVSTIEQILQRHTRKIDVGLCQYTDDKNHVREAFFVDCVNIGLAASITQIRSKVRHFMGRNTIAEIFSSLALVFRRKSFDLSFHLPGEIRHQNAMTLCIGSAKGYGQTPGAVPYNGLLDISLVKDSKTWKIFQGIWLMIRGRFLAQQNLMVWRTKQVKFDTISNAPVSIDGYVLNHKVAEMVVTIKGEELNFIIPTDERRFRRRG